MNVTSLPRVKPLSAAMLAIVPVVVSAIAGSLATTPNISGWYSSLAKPSFNPPNWIFGPVWSVLYVMMAYAFYRIIVSPDVPARRAAIAAFLIQITLNACWPFAFFGAHSPVFGLIVVITLWLALLTTLLQFWRIDRTAGALLAPCFAWVSFATLLNAAILRLN